MENVLEIKKIFKNIKLIFYFCVTRNEFYVGMHSFLVNPNIYIYVYT